MRAETPDARARLNDDDLSRAMRRFVRETFARTSEDETSDPGTWMNIFASVLEGFRRSCARALDVGGDEMTRVLREAGTKWEGKAREDEGKARETTRELTRARREIERLNEKLGREMIRRGADEEGEGEGVELARRETTLYREACRKYRKRAEHYEALYRKMGGKDVEGTTTTTRVGRGGRRARDERREGTSGGRRALDGVDGDAATRRRRLEIFRDDDEDERRGREKFARRAREGDAWEKCEATARRRVDVEARDGFRRVERREDARDEGVEYEDELWGATQKRRNDDDDGGGGGDARARRTSAQGDSERPHARENLADAANEAPRRRAGEAPPLDRIFLDSKNAPASSPSRENGDNKVRKNKRLSDNAPRSPNAVFDDAGNARRRATKYQDVVRKKSERELLDAYVCPDCQTFYDAMMPGKDRSTIKCTHAPPRENVIANSRHRAKWAPEPAPKGFWNLAFTPEK